MNRIEAVGNLDVRGFYDGSLIVDKINKIYDSLENRSCENCVYNRLNDADFHFINKCTKIDICPSDMKIKGFSCSFFKDYKNDE